MGSQALRLDSRRGNPKLVGLPRFRCPNSPGCPGQPPWRSMLPDSEQVLAHLGEPSYRPAKMKELARELGVSGDDYRPLRQLMHTLEGEGKVTRANKGRYLLPESLTQTWGRLRLHERGFGFVVRAGAEADVFVAAGFLLDAKDGEWVEVEITESGDGQQRLP
ncbi:MAG TPA: hypothetical protein EYQ31_08340, partial [Candidatus Handelsmanbacteria bacterium]|nr:hypothetical protein [Candidatus Handelsmanbacteria bacterium]